MPRRVCDNLTLTSFSSGWILHNNQRSPITG
jgi:hypothetical protein